MTEDFALIDFAVSARPPAEIAEAIGRVRASAARARLASESPAPAGRGFLSRVFRRAPQARAEAEAVSNLRIQPRGTLSPGPLTRVLVTELGYATSESPVRITAPLGAGGLSLIEFRDGDAESSAFCAGLSAEMPGDELFYFRYSGSRHPGAHFAFHVYQDGRLTRRAVSFSADGTAPEAEWTGIDAGMPHPLETDSLPPPGTPHAGIMTPVRQATILEALGIDPETLFTGWDETTVVLELSSDPGGRPLSEAQAEIHRQRTDGAPALQDVLVDTPPPPQVPPNASLREVAKAAALAQQPADAAQPPQQPAPPKPPQSPHEQPASEPSWEEEVTSLLVAAVETTLPAEEQVAWLDALTATLVSGDIDSALREANRMIALGDRPEADKQAASARLAELFGVAD
ncbi:hypothetical protein CLV78_109111 [Aliiruegeria haliotis]|uniref:Uncharacterized protein n=1 Tax=Aliiruegeria haliotis TaxID=1280846 RepID=A0A2T0RK09_9RHOB|nr:hypothetical protein [Aliiruegeria haliotis]PRY21498.1 hypothetical protein CLV78_109111 [Aliiruegeria haliotis]